MLGKTALAEEGWVLIWWCFMTNTLTFLGPVECLQQEKTVEAAGKGGDSVEFFCPYCGVQLSESMDPGAVLENASI